MMFSLAAAGWLPLIASVLSLLPVVGADADFLSVRTRLNKDHSGKAGDPKEKYFHESVFHPHYDGRFAESTLAYEERRDQLVSLVQSYLSTMNDIGAETWLMHGTLMGWWWNRKILPWDSDIDVQVTIETLGFLATYYNLSVFQFKTEVPLKQDASDNKQTPMAPEPSTDDGPQMYTHSYMLEINPDFDHETQYDKLNMIDARWIDMDSGLFIDITAVRPNMVARKEGIEGALKCKDKHRYIEGDIFPLRDSVFETIPVKIPYEYTWLLEEEYSRASLTRTAHARHHWNEESSEWDPDDELSKDRRVDETNMRRKKKPTGRKQPAGGGRIRT